MLVSIAGARTVPDPTDATGFFTTVADKLLRSTFSFGITNIPVQTNGVFVYTPAVQRLLQVAANLRDAATTNFYPTVYRPIFFRDAVGNVFITGYQQVVSVTGANDPQFSGPLDISTLPSGVSSNVNIYGVPWIIGAKKNLPNFNEFYSIGTIQVSRKLQFTRQPQDVGKSYTAARSADYQTNQMITMGITNSIGFSMWNSYNSAYPNGALNYPYATPDLTLYVSDFLYVKVSNGIADAYVNNVFVTYFADFTVWPGSASSTWNATTTPTSRQPAQNAYFYGSTNFTILPTDSLTFNSAGNFTGFDPAGPSFDISVSVTPVFPQINLVTTNLLRAFILDHGHVLDYVQFAGPSSTSSLAGELKDPDGPYNLAVGSLPAYMWSTNLSNAGVNWGLQNQINVSRTDAHVPPGGRWSPPGGGAPTTPLNEAREFNGFFTPTWSDGVKIYTNSALTNYAPFTPVRTITAPTIWVANDPLVHYLAGDLNLYIGALDYNGVAVSDDPAYPAVSLPQLTALSDRYQPWGRNAVMNGITGVVQDDPSAGNYNASYNMSYKDPLVYGPDDWNFPAANSLPLTTLGQVHRGTPWQTIYLKATNLLQYVDATQFNPFVGINTWQWWTGDFNASDAALMSPTSDWRLAALLTELFNTNDATTLQSVNSSTADWLNALNGITVQTNSTANPYYTTPPQFDSLVMASNSPQAAIIANALGQAKSNQPNQRFISAGDFLSAPEISQSSPWLNQADAFNAGDRIDYTISDAAYEAIPSQLLPLLRPDSSGGIISTNGGWSVQFSGGDGFSYILQASTNLVDWNAVSTNCPVQGMFNSAIAPAPSTPEQFYRSVLRP